MVEGLVQGDDEHSLSRERWMRQESIEQSIMKKDPSSKESLLASTGSRKEEKEAEAAGGRACLR